MAGTAKQLDGRRIQTGLRAPADSMTLGVSPDVVPPDVIVSPKSTGPVDLKRANTQSTESTQTTNLATASLPTPAPFVRVPEAAAAPAAYAFDMRGQWEGTVTHIGADEFSVVLRDIFNPGAKEYEAVFSIDEVADDDRDLLKEGAILYWTIGYQQRRGQRLRISDVRLRRLPAWSRADLLRVAKAARELDDLFEP